MRQYVKSALFYAALLKDAGCSSNASRFAALFGTADQDAKYRMKLTDWHHRARLAARTAMTVARGRGLREKARHFFAIARAPGVTREIIQIRCDRGAEIAGRLGLPHATREAIRSLDEHWSGLGYPRGLACDAIPLLARITNLAQTVELFHARGGVRAALRVVRQRRGSWFDSALADCVLGWARDVAWWRALSSHQAVDAVLELEPARLSPELDALGIENVAEAFAEIIDAKSPFTYRHSANVADIAVSVAAHPRGASPASASTNPPVCLQSPTSTRLSRRTVPTGAAWRLTTPSPSSPRNGAPSCVRARWTRSNRLCSAWFEACERDKT